MTNVTQAQTQTLLQSSDPHDPRHCTTDALAGDAADLAASLGWDSYHVIGRATAEAFVTNTKFRYFLFL